MISLVEQRYETGRIRDSANLVALVSSYGVHLRRSGTQQVGLCPFHKETSPSFFVHPMKQVYHCHGCGAGGDAFGFIKRIEGVDFGRARAILAERAGITLSGQRQFTREEKREFARQHKQAGKEADAMLDWRAAMILALRRERDRYLRSYHELLHVKPRDPDDDQGRAEMALSSEVCGWLWSQIEDLDHRIGLLRNADPAQLLPLFRGSLKARKAVAA